MKKLAVLLFLHILLPAKYVLAQELTGGLPIGRAIPVILVLDKSGSMSGKPIEQLNEALKEFYGSIKINGNLKDRIYLAIVAFDTDIQTNDFEYLAPNTSAPTYEAANETYMAAALGKTNEMIIAEYTKNQDFRVQPIVILITDGRPTDGDEAAINAAEELRKLTPHFKILGVEGADFEFIKKISGYNEEETAPSFSKIKGTKYRSLFKEMEKGLDSFVKNSDSFQTKLQNNQLTGSTLKQYSPRFDIPDGDWKKNQD